MVQFHRLIAREVIGKIQTQILFVFGSCLRTLAVILFHIFEVIGNYTTSHRLLRLIVQPIADCHDRLHKQSQIAMTGCTINHRLPRLVSWPITAPWGMHGLCLELHSLCWGLHGLCQHVVSDWLKPHNSILFCFSDFYTFEYLIYLYTVGENLGTPGKIFLGEIGVKNN